MYISTNIVVTRLKKSSVMLQKNGSLSARKEELVHKASHMGWLKHAAC